MADSNNLVKINTIIYESQLNKIKNYHKKSGNISEAQSYRNIFDSFFKQEKSKLRSNISIHVIYPVILCLFCWFSFKSTDNLIEILYSRELYFNELYILNRIFGIISFGAVGWLGASFYLMFYKMYFKKDRS